MRQKMLYKIPKKEIHLELYVDESKNRIYKLGDKNETINYIMIMAIPVNKKEELYNKLNNARCLNENNLIFGKCDNKCKFHSENNGEIHYKNIDRVNVKYKIAEKWLDILLDNNFKKLDSIYFNILGIIDNNLNKNLFGIEKQNGNIYSRFFRTALLRLLKMYSNYDKIIIEHIYHDKTDEMETHPYFKTNAIQYIQIEQMLEDESKVGFFSNKIEFIDSDHRKSNKKESQFIQFVDLILGTTCNVIHNEASNNAKVKLTEHIYPLISRILDKKESLNKNSRYNFFNKQCIGFFPSESKDNLIKEYKEKYSNKIELEKQLENGYFFDNNKQILFKIDDGQISLF